MTFFQECAHGVGIGPCTQCTSCQTWELTQTLRKSADKIHEERIRENVTEVTILNTNEDGDIVFRQWIEITYTESPPAATGPETFILRQRHLDLLNA